MKWLGLILALGCAVPLIVLQWSNPDVTETRLMIDHWKTFLSCSLGIIIGLVWFDFWDELEKP